MNRGGVVLTPYCTIILALAVITPSITAQGAPGAVLDEQKISSLQGGLAGALADRDFFGSSLASLGDFDGDGVDDLVAGAMGGDSLLMLFMASDGTVASHTVITGPEQGVLFGRSVAALADMDGDGVLELAVGVSGDDDGGNDRGAVFILFMNADGTVKSSQKISDLAGGFTGILDDLDRFGIDVERLGDLDGNGVDDLAVGAYRDDDGGFEQGAFWILFLAADGTVASHTKISATSGGFSGALDPEDWFGYALSNPGDLDGNGVDDLFVGTPRDDDGGTNRGAVWVLYLDATGSVVSHGKISDTSGGFSGSLADNDFFGSSVEALGDFDQDGLLDLAVGARQDSDGGVSAGAVWTLFLAADESVLGSQEISATTGNFTGPIGSNDLFGWSVLRLGDLDGDGRDDLVVSAIGDDDGGPERGALYVLFQNAAVHAESGGGTSGIAGVPQLTSSGAMTPLSTITLELTDAPPNEFILLWISPASAPLPIFGGTLHAFPFSDQFLLGTNAAGTFSASTPWPPAVPMGTNVWFQFLVQDLSVVFGITLSNAVKITTP